MFIHDSPVCFVNAHLSSGEKVGSHGLGCRVGLPLIPSLLLLPSQDGDEAKRNADVLDILQRCDFSAAALYDQSMATSSASMLGEAIL